MKYFCISSGLGLENYGRPDSVLSHWSNIQSNDIVLNPTFRLWTESKLFYWWYIQWLNSWSGDLMIQWTVDIMHHAARYRFYICMSIFHQVNVFLNLNHIDTSSSINTENRNPIVKLYSYPGILKCFTIRILDLHYLFQNNPHSKQAQVNINIIL